MVKGAKALDEDLVEEEVVKVDLTTQQEEIITQQTRESRKDDDRFAPHQVGKQPKVTYDTVKERIEQYI